MIDVATRLTAGLINDPEAQSQLVALHPFRGLGIPDDIARAALFLASEDASWVSGVSMPDKGNEVLYS